MRRIVLMIALIVAGELVYGLPFHTARFFRPTLLDVFNITNTQLGDLFAVFGITAMLTYFPGGVLADRFSSRSLMTVALLATAAGGLYMATFPGPIQMAILYGFWGITTSFLLWGALIRATRAWGGDNAQGVAFGVLEGGRGLAAAAVALFAVGVLANYLPDNARLATPVERESGMRTVILLYSLITFLAGVFTWVAVPADSRSGAPAFNPMREMGVVLRKPVLWAQAMIIVCAYCCYKGLDTYSLYAVEVLGKDEVEGARLAAIGAWTRPVAALLAGLVADRFNAIRPIGVTFAVLLVSYLTWSMAMPVGAGINIIYLNFFASYFAVFALRGIYFALLEANATPKFLTGAAVGMVSFVGYSPEIFFAPIAGRILDANPGLVGHQNYFMFLAAIAAAGILVVGWLLWLHRQGTERLWRQDEARAK